MAIPIWKICDRTGLSKWLALLAVPLVGAAVPWIIAFSKWPKLSSSAASTGPQRGVVYTEYEVEEFKRQGLM
jgi:hypothetical protein